MTVLNWYLAQLAAHPLIGLAVQAGLILAICYGLGAIFGRIEERHERRCGIRDLELRIDNPAVRAHYLDPEWEEDLP